MSDQVLNYALTGDASGAKAAFADVGASIARTSQRTDEAAKSVASIAAKLDQAAAAAAKQAIESNKSILATAGLGQAAAKVEQQIPGLSGILSAFSGGPLVALAGATATAGVGFVMMAKQGIDFADSLNDLSDRLGVPVETLSRLAPVAELGGTSLETLSAVLGKFAAKVSAGDSAIASLGLNTTDAVGAMIEIADKVKGATSQTEAIAIAQAAYGKQWQELMPVLKMGGSFINDTMSDAAVVTAETAIQAAKVNDEFTLLQNQMLAISVTFGTLAMPALQKLVDLASQFATAMSGGAASAKLGADNWAAEAASLKAQLDDPSISDWKKIKLQSQMKDAELKSRNYALTALSISVGNESGPGSMGGYRGETASPVTGLYESPEQIAAREKAAANELKFQQDLQRQLAELGVTGTAREVLAIQNKYAKLLDEHKKYGKSRVLLEQALSAELANYYMKQNFAGLAAERDSEQASVDFSAAQNRRNFQNPWVSNDEARAVRKMQGFGLVGENGVGVFDATQMDLAEMEETLRNYEASLDPVVQESIRAAAEMEQAWQGVTESIAGTVASNLAPALIDAFTRPQEALQTLGNVGTKILADLATQLLEVGIKWAILSALTGAGGKDPGSFLSFLSGSFGGHADGTTSSPGGLRFLGEEGPEQVTTPMGGRYMASFGLYQVPSGTRVEKTEARSPGVFAPQFAISNSDPIQTAEIVRRTMREEFSKFFDEGYRSRTIDS